MQISTRVSRHSRNVGCILRSTLTTYFIFSHICLYTHSGCFDVLHTGFFCIYPLCQLASMATGDTQTIKYPVSSVEVTADARKLTETGDWHPWSLWSGNKARVLGAGSRATLALNRLIDPKSQTWISLQCVTVRDSELGKCEPSQCLLSTSVSEKRH
jgi:hypothetical protein